MSSGTFMYPNVTSLPSQTGIGQADRPVKKQEGVPHEFDQIFDRALEKVEASEDLNKIKAPLKFSAHATQRMKDRKIAMDPMTMGKISDAVDRADAKGIEDTLVLTSDAALIINVKNRTVVTAMDRGSLSGNVFTHIDGAVII